MKSRHSPDPEAAVRTRPTPAAAVSAAGVVTRHGKSERLNIIVKFALNLSPSFVPVALSPRHGEDNAPPPLLSPPLPPPSRPLPGSGRGDYNMAAKLAQFH